VSQRDILVEETAMVRVRESTRAGAAVGLVLLGLMCGPAAGRDVKLAIRPQKISAEAGKYSLLPPPASLRDGDAVPLYEKAVKALPDKKNDDQVQQYLKMPIEQLPADQVEQVLQAYVESLKSVAQAVRCRDCKWPAQELTGVMSNLSEYRRVAYAVRLWVRSEIAQENYEGALLAMQIGFGMSRHLVQAPTLVQFLVGQAVAAMMSTEVGAFLDAGEAPSLHAALAVLPKPFADVEKAIDRENKSLPSEPPAGEVARQLFENALKLKAQSYRKMRASAKHLDRDLTVWQCLEAIRLYAGAHSGRLPQTLTDIKEITVPKDPVTGEAFRYTCTGATAVLESPAAPGGEEKDAVRCEITIKN
jgi:hypothetical protein